LKIKRVPRAKFPIVGFVKDPASVAALHVAKREGKDFAYVKSAPASIENHHCAELLQHRRAVDRKILASENRRLQPGLSKQTLASANSQASCVPLADPRRFIQSSRRTATLNPLATNLPSKWEIASTRVG
jgi:hypothetical protein